MYKYKNYTYSLEEIQNAADKKNLSIDEYIKEYDIELVSTADETEVAEEVITDPTKEGKKKPTTEESATVVEETVALEPTPVTEFKPVATSLELQKKIDNELKTTEVKTGTVANTEEVNKIYEKAAEDVPVALDEILKARERISTPQIKAQTASNYFNLEEVNRGIEQAIPTGFGTQSVSEKEPTQEEKEERIYNNGLNMPNATPESAQEYLDTYKNYIKTGELIPTDNQKEYLTKIQEISKEQLITTASQEIAGEYSEATQGIVENLINKNKDFKTIEEANSYIDESSKIFSNREKKFTKDIEQFNVDVNKWKNEINFIDKELENLNKKNNNFQNPAEYTQNSVDQYNALINKRNSLIKSSQAQVLEEQELNLSQEQSSLIDFQKTVTNKVLKFQNEESALRALEKDYSFSTRAALKMEQAFGGFGATSLAMLAKVGAELMTPGKYGGSFATVALDEKRDNTLIKTADNFLTSAIDYNRALEEKIAKVLPTSVTVKQVGEGKVSFGRFLSEAIANGSPTLVATLGPAGAVRLGSRLAGQAMLKPAMARAAANLSAVLLANQAGGGEMSSLLIAKEDAPLRIAQLEETLKSAKDPVEIQKINNEITNLRDSMNLSTAKIGFAGLLSAGIEGFTERFGTLALINKATPYVPGTSAFKKILTGGKTFGKGLLQENAEEVIAGISNNILVQNALLKRDVNVFEGVDLDLIANTTVVSAVMLGQGFGANTRSAFLELTTNVEEANRFQSLTRKLIDLQSSNSTDKRKQTKEILQQLGLENMISLSKLNTMTPQELQDLGNMQTQINKLNREASQFGVSMSQKGEITAADRNTLKKMEEQFEVLRSRKNDLLKTRRGGLAAVEAKEKSSGEQQINNPRFNFYSNSYNAFKVLTEGMMPKGGKYIEFEKTEDLNFTEEQKQKFLKDINSSSKVKDKAKTFEEAIMKANAWQDGNNIYVNLNGIYQQIIMDDNNSASFAVASPLHELSHIRNRNLKLNGRLADNVVNDAIEIIKANKDNLNKKDYESILNRLKGYKNVKEDKIKYEEFMQVLSDAQATGLINISDYININSFKDLIKYTGAKAFGDLSGIFFKIETSNDVFNYINSYRTIVKKGTLIGSGNKEEIETIIKESKSEDASNKVQELYEQKGTDGAFEIIEQFKPIVNKIVDKRKNAPGFDKQLLTDEIETGVGGILDLIQAYDPASNVPLAAYINKYLPVRSITASRRILGEEFTDDITESPSVAAEAAPEVEVEVGEKAPTKKLKEVKETLSEENQTELKNVVAGLELTEDQLTFKTLPNAAIEVFAKQIDIPAKKFDGKANFTINELDKVINFIEENIDTIRQALPEAAIAEGSPVSENLIGTATGVPTNLLKDSNLYTRQDRGTRLSGLIPYIKNKGIDNSSILKAIGNVDGRRMAGPRDKAAQTAKGLINVLAKFATNQEVRKQKTLTTQQRSNVEVGKGSKLLYSITSEAASLLNTNNIKDRYYKFEDKTGIDAYIADIPKMVKIFNTDEFKIFNATVLQFSKKALKDDKLRIYLRKKLGELKIEGKLEKRVSTGRTPYQRALGNTVDQIEKSIKSGKVEQFNKKHRKVWEQMIVKMNDAINGEKGDRDLALPIMYFLENSINERTNPWAMGGIFIGYSKATNGKFIYDHSFPQAQAARLIMNAILSNNNTEFNTQFERLKNNYYVIALTKEDQQKVNDTGGASTIGNNENWFDRLEKAKVDLSEYTYAGSEYVTVKDFVNDIKSNKNLKKSITKAAINNNQKLSISQRLPKGSTNEQVLTKMQELDNKANEARIKFSKSQDLDDTFNKIIENKTGIKTYERFDKSGATVKGASKGKFNFFIPPSAEDFVGLLYKTLGKGKVGDSQMQFYKDNLLDPYGRAMNDISSARVAMFEDYKTLKEDLKIIPKDLNKKSVEEYTKEQAVRVYIWNQQENKIPGIFKTNQQKLVDYVNENSDLKTFADQLMAMQKGDGYVTPKEGWLAGTITTDLLDSVNSIKRKKYLEQWQTNVDEMFGETNMDKLEAAFGKPYRRALEDALSRMKSGRNKKFTTGNEQVDRWTNWVNNSVGTIMFLNSRSAILQTLSTVNFINFEDNNIFKAGAAFANQPQYWKDFKFLFNSDFLKERRGGLRFNVSESEIADAAKKGGARGVVSKILQAGFLPTQMADSFAIAAGGATFYRNRLNTYLKQTDTDGNKLYTEAEAQEKTFLDFRETAEESQQSSRPDRISMEQAGPLGRTILAFANTPAQYTRIMKKAALDIKNGRGSLKANVSRLIYYGVVQNIIFGAIQAAMFSLAFGDGDEEDQLFEEKAMRVANGTADSILRGAGLYGAIAATIKNTAIKLIKESKKDRTDYFEAGLVELAGISPPIQSKVKKWRSATKSYEYNKKEMAAKGFSLDSPSYLAGANVIAAFTNLPTDRVVKKVTNVYDAMQEDVEVWKRTALLMGWSKWELEPTVKKAKKKKSSSKRKKVGRKTIQRKTIKRKTVK